MKSTIPTAIAAAVIALATGTDPIHGQSPYPYLRPSPPSGNVTIPAIMSEPLQTFDQLVTRGVLIVDGTVVSVMPPIIFFPDVAGQVETDALISIRQVIRGQPSTVGQILLIQNGGVQGKWNVAVDGDVLVQAGERYIFFLAPDYRKSTANSDGLIPAASVAARYYSVGYGNGKALVGTTGTIQFRPGAITQSHKYDGNDINSFITTIKDRVNTLFPPTPPYPTGAKPVPRAPGGPLDPSNRSTTSTTSPN